MEMTSNKEKNEALKKAVEEGNVEKVHELLDKGAEPNYLSNEKKTLIKLAMEQNYIDTIKLLIQYGAEIKPEDYLDEYIFDSADCSHRTKELVAHIFEYNNTKDIELLGRCLFFLTWCRNHEGPPGLEIFRLLLDLGLPVDEFISGTCTPEDDLYTPLHQVAMEGRVDFVRILIFLFLYYSFYFITKF